MPVRDEFVKSIQALRARICKSVTVGKSTGSIINIAFEPFNHEDIHAENSILVYGAFWSIQGRDGIVVNSNSEYEDVHLALAKIVEKQILACSITIRDEVTLDFSGGFTVYIEPHSLEHVEDLDNYVLFTPFKRFAIRNEVVEL